MHWETRPGREPKPWQTMPAALRAQCHDNSKLVWNSSTDKGRALDPKPMFSQTLRLHRGALPPASQAKGTCAEWVLFLHILQQLPTPRSLVCASCGNFQCFFWVVVRVVVGYLKRKTFSFLNRQQLPEQLPAENYGGSWAKHTSCGQVRVVVES